MFARQIQAARRFFSDHSADLHDGMLGRVSDLARPSTNGSLSGAFCRLGWLGFWLQLAIGTIPLLLLIYSVLFGGNDRVGTRGGFALVAYLTVGSLLVLAFTTIWFYRYTRLGKQMAEPGRRPPMATLRRAAWIGVAAGILGIVFSALVMLFEVAQLLLYFLRAPQVGVPVIQTTGSGSASWLSASDVLNLLGLIFTMLVEVCVLSLSLWLLFRTTAQASEFHPADDEDDLAHDA
ncbi:MAG TPA: DUF3611 family protein [Verrucomicrobiae bacterium]|nr:DUF3611 family protein [Verrucomicrobiae bacterium]